MTTLTVDGKSTLIKKDDPEYEKFIELGEKLSLGMIPPVVSNPQMELFKTVTMGALPVEIQERFEDTWSGKYYLFLQTSGLNQILFRWKTVWIYGDKMDYESDWDYKHVSPESVLGFFVNQRTKYSDFDSEKIIAEVKDNSEKGLTLRYRLSNLVCEYRYLTEKNNLAWSGPMLISVAFFARRWIHERKNFEYFAPA